MPATGLCCGGACRGSTKAGDLFRQRLELAHVCRLYEENSLAVASACEGSEHKPKSEAANMTPQGTPEAICTSIN